MPAVSLSKKNLDIFVPSNQLKKTLYESKIPIPFDVGSRFVDVM